LLSEIAAALALDPALMPDPLPAPPGPAETRRVKALRALGVERAEALGVAPEMLAKRRDLEDLVRRAPEGDVAESPLMNGWRRDAIGDSLRDFVRASA
jgi:ribonuclease D